MGFLDGISDLAARISPSKTSKPVATGIGQGHGMVYEDNMIVSKPAIVFHASQMFFNFLAMACFASVASFQAKWKVGPSGLTGFALFISISSMFLSALLLAVPVVYEKHDKLVRLARAFKEVRVSFILTGTGVVTSLLIAFIVTISAWTEPGCKDPNNDPHAKELGDDFKNGLSGWCSTKKAGGIFFWLAFGSWAASMVLLVLDWRSGKLTVASGPRDPPFRAPTHEDDVEEGVAHDHEEDELEDEYTQVERPSPPAGGVDLGAYTPASHSTRYQSTLSSSDNHPSSPFADDNRVYAGRQSMDAYGAFSDPAPSGFAQTQQEMPRVSRTMQYADPYAAVRSSIGAASAASVPPSYDSYSGYR
ncbi:hypothetical protein H0H92_008562 [Tricholoma furcatifolium]|nr:hypothetical protein H0H92_008562 [Tricholoma furcatifolium]